MVTADGGNGHGLCCGCAIDHGQLAKLFVADSRTLLFSCLVRDVYDPFDSSKLLIAPEFTALLDEDQFIEFAIRLDRQDDQIAQAIQSIDDNWLGLPPSCKERVVPAILLEVERRKFEPLIVGLFTAFGDGYKDLSLLSRQLSFMRDVSHLETVLQRLESTLSDRCSPGTLAQLYEACAAADEPPESPVGEIMAQLRFYAREALEEAPVFAARHFKPKELLAWDLDELTRLFRSRYPLLTMADVEGIRQNLADQVPVAPELDWSDSLFAHVHDPLAVVDELAVVGGD